MNKKTEAQLDKFKAAAKEAGADMDEKSFDEALGKLAKSEPPPEDAERSPTDDKLKPSQ